MNWPFSTRVLITALTGTILASLLATIIYFQNSRIVQLQKTIAEDQEIIRHLRLVQTQIADLENDERGYLITGDEVNLKAFETSILAFDSSLNEIESLMLRFGRSTDGVKVLRDLSHRWIEEAKASELSARQKLKEKAISPDDFMQSFVNRSSKKLIVEFRTHATELADQVFTRLNTHYARVSKHSNSSKQLLSIGLPICLLISFIILLITIRRPLVMLAGTVEGLSETSHGLEEAGNTLSRGSNRYRQAAKDLTISAESTRIAIRSIDELTNESAQRALSCGTAIGIVQRTTQEGSTLMNSLSASIDSMQAMHSRIMEFNNIFESIDRKAATINDIAFQSKVLSFNASIEASSAGNYGASFGIIAQAIAKLSETSAALATDVQGLMELNRKRTHEIVEELQASVTSTAFIGEQAIVSFDAIAEEIQGIQERIRGIIALTQEQKRSVEHLAPTVESQNAAMSMADSLTHEILQSAQGLRDQSVQLNGIIGEVHRLVL
jgi:methyl-accepting chemotaxis protein